MQIIIDNQGLTFLSLIADKYVREHKTKDKTQNRWSAQKKPQQKEKREHTNTDHQNQKRRIESTSKPIYLRQGFK